jgi:hypothetical protein
LRTGRLKASVRLPTREGPVLDLPKEFWTAITHERFKQIRTDKDRKGVFEVRLRELAEYYVAWLEDTREAHQSRRDELISAFTVQSKAEAFVKFEEWDRFLRDNNFTEEQQDSMPKRGRPATEGWKEVLTFVAASMLAEPNTQIKPEALAEQASEWARRNSGRGVPAVRTVKDQVTTILDLAEKLRKK